MRTKTIALVPGDGAAPEMMQVATKIAQDAARLNDLELIFEETPMGWAAYEQYGDTLGAFDRAVEIGTIFFGGVGDPQFDNTIGKDKPEMKPEARTLLKLRKEMGLLLNFRPMRYFHTLRHLANVKPEMVPEQGIQQIWIRFLLEDSYFGTQDLGGYIPDQVRRQLGIMAKNEVAGYEFAITDLAYYDRRVVERYFRAAFRYAREAGLPLISVDKANVMARYDFWRKIATRIGAEEFPDVPLTHQYVDSANALLFTPAKLHGVIACGNEHGDILSDGAAAALGSMGLMCSSAINPDTGAAMFESGAGTAPTLKGTNKANPIGRILTAALMLRHIGAPKGADAIERTVQKVLTAGYRTHDLFDPNRDPVHMLYGTREMGDLILDNLFHVA